MPGAVEASAASRPEVSGAQPNPTAEASKGKTGNVLARVISGFQRRLGSKQTIEGMASGQIPPPEGAGSVAAVLQGERAQAEARGAANPGQEALMGVASSGIDAADLGPDGQVRSPQTETSVTPQTPVSESVGAEQPLIEASPTTPTNNEPIDLAAERAQRRPDTNASSQTGSALVDASEATRTNPTPESSAQPDAKTAVRQQEAFNEINNLNYVVTADTDPAVLFAQLVKEKGWTADKATADHVRGAVDFAKSQLTPEAAAALPRVGQALPEIQENAFTEISGLGYEITTDTDPAVLLAHLVQTQGWKANADTAAYVQAAVDKVRPQAPDARSVGGEADVSGPEPVHVQTSTDAGEGANREQTTVEAAATEGAQTPESVEVQQLKTEIAELRATIASLHQVVEKMAKVGFANAKTDKDRLSWQQILGMLAIALVGEGFTAAQAEAIGQQQAA